MENRKKVILQAHMDMVPQKNNDTVHDFENDPIETYIDGDWVKAKGTTLGADDGMGVAAIMAIMEDKTLKHGPLEALITADEETGMFGAFGLKPGTVDGDILLNLDSEEEGELYIGCAGGEDLTAVLEYKEVETDPADIALKVTLKGLRGGHSGLEINEGRANANKLMARFMNQVITYDEACLVSWQGGNMRNAIPRECEVVITVPAEEEADVLEFVQECEALWNEEYHVHETPISFKAERVELPAMMVPDEIKDNLVDAIYACQNGVMRMIPTIPKYRGNLFQSGYCFYRWWQGGDKNPGPQFTRFNEGLSEYCIGKLFLYGRYGSNLFRWLFRLGTQCGFSYSESHEGVL